MTHEEQAPEHPLRTYAAALDALALRQLVWRDARRAVARRQGALALAGWRFARSLRHEARHGLKRRSRPA